jgi:hypothetical protein
MDLTRVEKHVKTREKTTRWTTPFRFIARKIVPVANSVQPPRVVPVSVANNVHQLQTKEQLWDYLHRAAGHPVKKTWLAAIKAGEYATWPGLTYKLVSNHLYDTEETAVGHLHKRRQNIRSTKIKPVQNQPVQNTVEDLEPELQGKFFIKKDRTERVGVHLVGMEDLNGMISTDQTGRFPIKSLTAFMLRRQYWRHFWGSFFYGGISPSKIGLIAPY